MESIHINAKKRGARDRASRKCLGVEVISETVSAMCIAVPFLLKVRRVPAYWTKNCRVIDADLALGQKTRDIARGELVLEVPAHRDDDDLREEMASFEELVQAWSLAYLAGIPAAGPLSILDFAPETWPQRLFYHKDKRARVSAILSPLTTWPYILFKVSASLTRANQRIRLANSSSVFDSDV
jgi:hypothetical protein